MKKNAAYKSIPGLYRRRKVRDDGKLYDAGAFVIDIQIKKVPDFAGMPSRLVKTTGVFPSDKDAEKIVLEMKLMVKELIQKRDAGTLKKILSGKLSLPSAYTHWRTGRIHLAEQFAGKRMLKTWEHYYDTAVLAEVTKVNRRATLQALVAHDLLNSKHVLNEAPDVLKNIRHHYQIKKQHPMFNAVRIELLTFLTKGLELDDGSALLQAVKKVRPLKEQKRRDHNPFESPHDCVAFCAEVMKRPTPNAALHAESVLFICLHGLRPEEFVNRRFHKDSKTGHMRIEGTKNPNANRVVPQIVEFTHKGDMPRIETLNATFTRMKTPNRCRDFRRTYALWCEKAGIAPSRTRAYMGHGAGVMTHLYQQAVPTEATLDEDREKLKVWFDKEAKSLAKERKQQTAPSAKAAVLSATQFAKFLKQLLKEQSEDSAFPWEDAAARA